MANLITSRNAKQDENALYYFRKDIKVNSLCESKINIFAESRYKLYINKRLVAVGPCRRSSEIGYYDNVDITGYLIEGENVIEVKVMQLSSKQCNDETYFLQSIIRNGTLGLCVWGNAGDVKLVTDESWKVAKEEGLKFFFKNEYPYYNVASISESINEYYGKAPDFSNAVVTKSIYSLDEEKGTCTEIEIPLKQRAIPMLYFDKKIFIEEKGDIYDAGKLTCGYIRLKCIGKGKIKLIYAEGKVFIDEKGLIKKRKRDDEKGSIIGQYDIIEVNGECNFEPFWMRTFRYIKIETDGEIQIASFDYLETGYPIKVSNMYDFGSDVDNKLFEISVNTLKRCMHETYMDCPYYEQLQYTMDTYLQIIFTYQLTQDKALPEKAIEDFASSYRVGSLTQSRYPTNKSQYIPGFSLFFALMIYEHFKRFSDKKFIRKYIHIVDGIIDWFINRLDGFMVLSSNLWDFIDWSDGYDGGQIPQKEPITVYSMMLAYVLKKTSLMHKMLGNDITDYEILAKKIEADIKNRCFDKKRGLYADSPSKTHFAQHAQIWAVLTGMETGERAKKILKESMTLTCKGTSAYMFLLFRALEKADIYDEADKYINQLRTLIKLGCTTTPEWLGENVRSECHAWSAVAIYEFTAKVLGVTYRDNTIFIKPHIRGRKVAKGEVATPCGMVYCEWEIRGNEIIINIKLPNNKQAELIMPDGTRSLIGSGIYIYHIKNSRED